MTEAPIRGAFFALSARNVPSRVIRLGVTALLAGFALAAGGCGGEDGQAPSNQLVRLAIQGKLDFRMDEHDGPEHVFRLDEATVIRRNGSGSRTSAAFDGGRPFRVSQAELDRLEEALGELDLRDLEGRFGTDESAASKTTLSYEGTTVVLGDRVNEVNRGEGDEQAERFFEVESMIERLSARALPASIKRANRRAERKTTRLIRKLNRRPTCEGALRFVRRNGERLSPDTKQKVYSRVRKSDQPCP